MKYNDRGTKLINFKHKNKTHSSPYEIRMNKCVKSFSKVVLESGIDPDWWSLVTKSDKYSLYQNYQFKKVFEENEDESNTTITILEYINLNKSRIYVDPIELRDLKLRKLIK